MSLHDWLYILIVSFFKYRFLKRVLGARFSSAITLPVLLVCGGLYGYANVRFGIAQTILGQVLYYCAGDLLLNLLLFHGRFLKLAFYSVLLTCSSMLISIMFFPLSYIFGKDNPRQLAVINAVMIYAGAALQGALLEYAGRRLHSLRYDFPAGYPLGLLITAFVSYASFTIMDLVLYATRDAPYPAILLGSALLAVGAAILILLLFTVNRQISLRLSEQQARLQAAHYKCRADDWKQTARIRHDMKNHLLCLDGLLQDGKTDQALCYVETLTHAVERLGEYVHTGNDFIDAIMNEKQAEALAQNIAFTIDMTLPAQSRITPPDLCCVLGNVLDNAIEAAAGANEKWIKAQAFARQGQLVLTVRNSYQTDDRHPLFSRRPGRGYGLGNVRRVVEQYGGTMEVSANGCFIFSAMLPL